MCKTTGNFNNGYVANNVDTLVMGYTSSLFSCPASANLLEIKRSACES